VGATSCLRTRPGTELEPRARGVENRGRPPDAFQFSAVEQVGAHVREDQEAAGRQGVPQDSQHLAGAVLVGEPVHEVDQDQQARILSAAARSAAKLLSPPRR
jgi:hypothetical protein